MHELWQWAGMKTGSERSCGGKWRLQIFLLFLLFPVATSAPHCVFPRDFSHRSRTLESWLASRGKTELLNKWGGGRSWSKVHKLISRENSSNWDFEKSEERVEKFMKWVTSRTRNPSSPTKISLTYLGRPWWKSDGSQVVSSFSVQDLREGDIIFDLPVRLVMSDLWTPQDPKSLHQAPWEIRLASKLLRERSRGDQSTWASYIKLLPKFVSLPMFFSELEMNNVQDRTIESEVRSIRKYAKATYQALRTDEISGAKFSEYAWALSVVYSSACQVDKMDKKVAPESAHYLLPFFGLSFGAKGQVYATEENQGLKLMSHGVKEGMPLAAEYASSTMRDTFIFRGFVSQINQQDKLTVFRDLLDLVEWYSSADGAINNNRCLTLKIARDTKRTLAAHLRQLKASSFGMFNLDETEFSIGANGFVNHYIISIFAALSYAKQALERVTDVQAMTTIDFVVKNGTTPWEEILRAISRETVSRHKWNTMDCMRSLDSRFESAFKSAKSLLRQRLLSVLDSFSTDLAEDKFLLDAAKWEGMNELEDDQLACSSCRWQTEQMSFHDYLALQYRSSVKIFITEMLSAVSCGANITHDDSSIQEMLPAEDDHGSLQRFLKWCEAHDLTISERLAVTEILVPAKDELSLPTKVRGVVALRDISQGETLSSLPMTVGLFNNDSVGSISAVDAWDFAAARLLREKAKGNDSAWAPYISILPEYLPTPIHLNSLELKEVQWWPVMRELVQVRKAIKESFSRLSPEELALASYSDYKWAVTMVHSRAFTLPVKPDEQYEQYVLMPFMDMINHHYRYKADWMSEPVWNGKLDIIAKRTVRQGEELFASFGPRTNDNLFLYYGFVLDDNPFDAVQLFGSFEEALRWFVQLWTQDCPEFVDNELKASRCQQKKWQTFWSRVKDAVEEAESGSGAQGRDWGQLLTYWADLGFQFLPYQPGPSIYPGGIIDPSFLTALSSSSEVLDTLREEDGVDSPWPDHCPECGNRTAVGSSAMRKFFTCIEKETSVVRGLLDGHICRPELTRVLLREENLTRATLFARISVALRCSEILASFPTTITEDRELLKQSSHVDTCTKENAYNCKIPQTTSSHLQLTRRYRYIKKILLKTPIDKLLN